MLVWLDALTSKQGTLLSLIAKELIRLGHDVLVTCRRYEFTEKSILRWGFNPIVVGEYAEGGPTSKVLADIHRMEGLLKVIDRYKPSALVAYPNPPAARVAFGVGIKYIALTDSPHATIPSRLSLPLADVVIASNCIPSHLISRYMFNESRLIQYNGVDELAWILRTRPKLDEVTRFNLTPYKYVVYRPHEYRATYYPASKLNFSYEDVVKTINNLGFTAVVIPRYSDQVRKALELMRLGYDVRLIWGECYDGISLTFYAVAAVTGGATLAREAALLGTPGITYFPEELYVNKCLVKMGYPVIKVRNLAELREAILTGAKDLKKRGLSYNERLSLLSTMFEDPVMKVVDALISTLRS